MNQSSLIAKHFKELYFGGNWTEVNLKESLEGISWQQATTKISDFNTIAVLVYHLGYYVSLQLKVMKGGSLKGTDQDSFNCPAIESEQDWQNLLAKTWQEAEEYVQLTAQLPEERLQEIFVSEKYGTWYRNLVGLNEHAHYHLGQIVLLKKLLQSGEQAG